MRRLASAIACALIIPSIALIIDSRITAALLKGSLVSGVHSGFLVTRIPGLVFMGALLVLISMPSWVSFALVAGTIRS